MTSLNTAINTGSSAAFTPAQLSKAMRTNQMPKVFKGGLGSKVRPRSKMVRFSVQGVFSHADRFGKLFFIIDEGDYDKTADFDKDLEFEGDNSPFVYDENINYYYAKGKFNKLACTFQPEQLRQGASYWLTGLVKTCKIDNDLYMYYTINSCEHLPNVRVKLDLRMPESWEEAQERRKAKSVKDGAEEVDDDVDTTDASRESFVLRDVTANKENEAPKA
jgi:hypothetical protein